MMRKFTLLIAAMLLACVCNARAEQQANPFAYLSAESLEQLKEASTQCKLAADAKDLEQTVLYCRQANNIIPLAENYLNIGSALFAHGRYEAAWLHFNEAANMNPRLSAVHFNLGLVWEALGRNDQAREQYQEALRLKDDSAQAAIEELDGKQTVARVAPK